MRPLKMQTSLMQTASFKDRARAYHRSDRAVLFSALVVFVLVNALRWFTSVYERAVRKYTTQLTIRPLQKADKADADS